MNVLGASKLIENMQAQQVPIELLRQVLDYYRENQPVWGPGALDGRLKNLRPGQRADELWPTPTKGTATAQERRLASARAEKAQSDAEAEQERLRASQKLTEGLEKRFGVLVDSFDSDTQRRLLAEHKAEEGAQILLRLVRNTGKPAGLVREALLDVCEQLQKFAE